MLLVVVELSHSIALGTPQSGPLGADDLNAIKLGLTTHALQFALHGVCASHSLPLLITVPCRTLHWSGHYCHATATSVSSRTDG